MNCDTSKENTLYFCVSLIGLSMISTVSGRTIYVDDDAKGMGSGSRWEDAFVYLQDALAIAKTGDSIHVGPGVYKPIQETGGGRGGRARPSDAATAGKTRESCFQLQNGVAIIGGYAGLSGANPDEWDTHSYEAILSGDVNGNDSLDPASKLDNSYHVVMGSGDGWATQLTGFTVTGGYADGRGLNDRGAGLYLQNVEATIMNCTFMDNYAMEDGGGIYCSNASAKIIGNRILGNTADHYGGGLYCDKDEKVINNLIHGNTARYGGGVFCSDSDTLIVSNTIAHNTATGYGGGGIYCGKASPVVVNTILWGDRPDEIYLKQGSIRVTHSAVLGGWPGNGNVDMNPLFYDADGGDDIIGTKDDNLRLIVDSPCIDAGRNGLLREFEIELDLNGNPRIQGEFVDLGAFEGGVAAPPQTLYVDARHGNDNQSGLSLDSALESVHEAVKRTQDGDTILVYPGAYIGEIDFSGKAITVQGVATTMGIPVLEHRGDFAVSFFNGEGPDSVLANCVIRRSFMAVFVAGSAPTLRNLTVVENRYGIEAYAGAEPSIHNCIIWSNYGSDIFDCIVNFSCVQDGTSPDGIGNISSDPFLASMETGDYHLSSKRGRYSPNHGLWVLDVETSPAIDSGNPAHSQLLEPQPHGSRINMGAYGGTAFASLSDNYPPHVVFVYPRDGGSISAASEIEVIAFDVDGSVEKVAFYYNDTLLDEDVDGSDGWHPTEMDFKPLESSGQLLAIATDNGGKSTNVTIDISWHSGKRR